MKKIFVLIALLLFSGFTFSQTLEKGNLIGLHESKITLHPDVSYNQYKEFLLNTLFPKIEEAYKGDAKLYLIEGIRGEHLNHYGWLFVFKSVEARDKWLDDNGNLKNTISDEFWETLGDAMDEQNKYIISGIESDFTDWIVQ
jgi:hypothetical protein